jgi:hypothetical protein
MIQVSDQREEFHLIATIPLYWDASLRNDSVGLYPSLWDASLHPSGMPLSRIPRL